MEFYNKTMCVSYRELTSDEGGEPVIKRYTLDKNIARGNVQRIKRAGGEGSGALIVYNSLPEKYRGRWEKKYKASPEELYKEAMAKKEIVLSEAARRFYEGFEYRLNGVQTHLSERLIDEYTKNASVLELLIKDLKNNTRLRKQLNNSNGNIWEIIIGNSEHLRQTVGHTLPKYAGRLRNKMREYDRPAEYNGETYRYNYLCVINKKIGVCHALKINKEVGELLIALKCSCNPVFTDRQIFERFNGVELPKHNAGVDNPKDMWKPLKSDRTVTLFLKENMHLWYGTVHGSLADRQKFNIKLNTELASCRDARWEGDGTKLNLYYRGEDGKRHTCTVYEVMDTYSEALLGYWISDTENYLQQYHAFRMAVQNTRRKPYEIVTDNQGGAKTRRLQDFMKAISYIARATMPNNPQSKTIESVLGRFQQQVLHQHWAFTGQNVTAKKAGSKPNLELVTENADKLPTRTELFALYAQMREMWNGERIMPTTETILKHPKTGIGRMEMYQRSQNELAPEMSAREMAESFRLWTDKPAEFTAEGITITVDNEKYRYDVFAQDDVNMPDVAWRRNNLFGKFWVKYDPTDMSRIKLYREDKAGGFRFERMASPPVKVHRAIQDRQAGEMSHINKILQANRQEQAQRYIAAQEIMWKHGTAPEQNGLYSPKLAGFTAEEMYELNLQVERKTRKYREKSIAQENKHISMLTYEEVANYDGFESGEVKKVANSDIVYSNRKSLEKL